MQRRLSRAVGCLVAARTRPVPAVKTFILALSRAHYSLSSDPTRDE